jgi:hypothetical protein
LTEAYDGYIIYIYIYIYIYWSGVSHSGVECFIVEWSVLEVRSVSGELLKKGLRMGCYLEDYRAKVGNWAGDSRGVAGQSVETISERLVNAWVLP